MKKKLALVSLLALLMVPMTACGDSGSNHSTPGTDSSISTDSAATDSATSSDSAATDSATSSDSGVTDSSNSGDSAVHEHEYKFVAEKVGNCSQKGEIAHYTCEECGKLFDLTKKEITSIEGDYDYSVHSSDSILTAQAQPTKKTYNVGEAFDPTGMVVVFKCNDCEGEIIDNQFLTYEYQTVGATSFGENDTKITVKFNDLSFEVEINVGKKQAQILGVKENYETTCGVAPMIEVTSNSPDNDIVIEYFDGDTAVTAADFVAGKTYTVKMTVADTDSLLGTEATATITVSHKAAWRNDEINPDRLVYACNCGESEGYSVMNNQEMYVDDADMSIDLSKLVAGSNDYTIQSVQQILLLGNEEKVAIDGENDGTVYTFAKEKYEKLTAEWTPYYLKLSVVYAFGEGNTVEVVFTAKYIEKVIRTAEDLKVLTYQGAADSASGGTMITGRYVLANDIDASGLVLDVSTHAWEAGLGFCGTLDGNGYTISNLTIPQWTNGLFGALGYNGKVENITFENVVLGEGANMFALVMRNSFLTNVDIQFSYESQSYKVAEFANECTFENVSILTEKGVNPFAIDDGKVTTMPETITFTYFAYYTVTFNANGGSAVEPISVSQGKKVTAPANPVKEADGEYEYEFLGWYVGETAWDFDTPVTGDMELTAKWEKREKAARVEVGLPLGQMTDTGEANEHGKVYDLKRGQWFIDNNIVDTMVDFQAGALAAWLPAGGQYYEFWLYNPTDTEYTFHLAGNIAAGWTDSVNDTLLAGKTWTKVTISAEDIELNKEGAWYAYIQGGNGDGAAQEGWQCSPVYAVMSYDWKPEEPTSNVLLNAATQTLGRWDYGGEITVTSTNDATYGDVWNVTVGAGVEQGIQHPTINTSGFEKVYFYVYNPCANAMRFNVHGIATWGAATIMLDAQSWTLIELPATLFAEGGAGQVHFIVQDPDAVSVAGEWKISSFYGLKAGETAPEVEKPVQPEEPTSNVLLNAATQTLGRWDYGGEITVTSTNDATYGDVWNVTVGAGVEQGIQHPTINTSGFEKVYFYVYNPCANAMRFNVHGIATWGAAAIMLDAQSWTLIELPATLFAEGDAGQVHFIVQDPDAVSVAGEWKISSFYGLKAGETAPNA